MRLYSLALCLLLLTSLGCTSAEDRLANLPPGTVFTPVSEADDFRIRTTLTLSRDPALPLTGRGKVEFDVAYTRDVVLRDVRTVVFLPPALEEELGTMPDTRYVIQFRNPRLDLSPAQPSFRAGISFGFPVYEKHQEIQMAFETPIRLKLVWRGGVRFLEIPFAALLIEIEEHD